MKHLRFILASLFVMLSLAAHAQQVVITKTNGTTEVFQPNEVDSVVYKPAPKYYYYAGWDCPTTEADLARKGTLIGTTLPSYSKTNPLIDYTKTPIIGPDDMEDEDNYYVVIPSTLSIYDSLGNDVTTTAFNKQTSNIVNYNIFKSKQTQWDIDAIVIY